MVKSMIVGRGLKAPVYKDCKISHIELIKFLEGYHHHLNLKNESEAAFRIEAMIEYLKQDFVPGEPLFFKPTLLGL